MPSVSRKQANFMSAIAHGWQAPQAHAPSLAVAKEFHAADKKEGKYMHAEGGKVRALEALAKMVPEYGTNDKAYLDILHSHGWNPEMTGSDLELMKHMAEKFPSDMGHSSDQLQELVDRYGFNLQHPLQTHRGMSGFGMDTNWEDLLRPGAVWKSDFPQSTSTLQRKAEDFVGYPNSAMLHIRHKAGDRLLPNPYSGQSELLLPGGDPGAVKVLKSHTMPSPFAAEGDPDVLTEAAVRRLDADEYAEGGSVDQPIDPSRTNRLLALVSHAADRATSTVTDDPHHALARVAAGLASQVAGQSPSGGVQFGKMPNLINEIKSLPAAGVDIGSAGANVLGALSKKYLPQVPGSIADLLSRLRDADNAYTDKHGDPAPRFARDAEDRSDAVHQGVNRAMGLSAPKGFAENSADALGNMLGQLPIPIGEAKTAARGAKAGLAALARAVPEYLGPTVRPSLRNYATGALGGGALGTLASSDDDESTPPVAESGMIKEKYE